MGPATNYGAHIEPAKGKMNRLQRPWPRWQWARTYSILLHTVELAEAGKARNTINRVRGVRCQPVRWQGIEGCMDRRGREHYPSRR